MDLFLFSGFNRFMHFLSTYAYSWIKIAARRTLFGPVWYPVGTRRRVGPGMALTTIGEVPQWGGVADWSSCRTTYINIVHVCSINVKIKRVTTCHQNFEKKTRRFLLYVGYFFFSDITIYTKIVHSIIGVVLFQKYFWKTFASWVKFSYKVKLFARQENYVTAKATVMTFLSYSLCLRLKFNENSKS